MALADREVEWVVTETGESVHAYWPHAHRTACGLSDDRVFPFVLLADEAYLPCARCDRFLSADAKSDAREGQ